VRKKDTFTGKLDTKHNAWNAEFLRHNTTTVYGSTKQGRNKPLEKFEPPSSPSDGSLKQYLQDLSVANVMHNTMNR
jgi:hypothetical protein